MVCEVVQSEDQAGVIYKFLHVDCSQVSPRGRQTEGCCLGCVEERGRERGSAAAGAWRKKKANLNIGRGKKQRREIRIEEKIFQFE